MGVFPVHMGVFYMSHMKHGWVVGGKGTPPAATCSSSAAYKSSSSLTASSITGTSASSGLLSVWSYREDKRLELHL